MATGLLLGELVAFADWHEGDEVQNLYPLPAERARQNAGNAVYLELHTETAFRPDTPDVVVLLCLRGQAGVGTLVSDLSAAVARLPRSAQALLAQPRFGFGPGGPAYAVVRPGRHGRATASYCEALTATDPEAAVALDRLAAEVARGRVEFELAAGDMLIVDNRRVVHGRTPLDARYDGTDRWLQRCLVRR